MDIESLRNAFDLLHSLNKALIFGGLFVWLAAWYILFQMTRLRFILLIIAGDILYAVEWVFVGLCTFAAYHHSGATWQHGLVLRDIQRILGFGGTSLTVAGAAFGLKYLQKRWSDKCDCQPPAAGDGSTRASWRIHDHQ